MVTTAEYVYSIAPIFLSNQIHSFILIINLYPSFSLVRYLLTNYIRTRCHSIISIWKVAVKNHKKKKQSFHVSLCLTSVDTAVSRLNKTTIDYDTSVIHTQKTSRYDVFFAKKNFRRPWVYIITCIMFIGKEHSPVRPVSKPLHIKTHFTTTRIKSTISMPSMYAELRRQASTLPSQNASSFPAGRRCGTTESSLGRE